MTTFAEVLEEYLDERERQNGDYYDNRYIGSKLEGCRLMNDLAKELDEIVQGVEEPKGYQPTGWVCPKCGTDRTKAACPRGRGAATDGSCPMFGVAQ